MIGPLGIKDPAHFSSWLDPSGAVQSEAQMGSKSMRPTTELSSSFKAQAQFQNTSEFGGPLKHNHRTESPKSPLHRFHLILRTRGRPPPAARRITNRATRGSRRERDGGRRPAAARARPPPPLLRRRIQTRLARGRSGRAAPPSGRGLLLPSSLLPCVARALSPFSCSSRRRPP